MTRDEPTRDGDKPRKKGKAIPRVRQTKIVRQADRVDPLTGNGRSKGYGFLELREHADALRVLRWANNNPDVPSLFSEWWSAELAELKKDADPARLKRITETESRGSSGKQPKGLLIVEFSIENVQVVQRRAARQNVDDAGVKRKSSLPEGNDERPTKKRKTSAEDAHTQAKTGPRPRLDVAKQRRIKPRKRVNRDS